MQIISDRPLIDQCDRGHRQRFLGLGSFGYVAELFCVLLLGAQQKQGPQMDMNTHGWTHTKWRSSSISNASSLSSGLWQNHQNAKKQSQNDSQINNQSNRNQRKNKSTLHSASIHNNIFTTNAGHAIAMFTPWLFDHHLRSFWWSALLTVW